jgi:hypothetical protein
MLPLPDGAYWLLILISLTLGDYFTRDSLRPGSSHKVPPEQVHVAP